MEISVYEFNELCELINKPNEFSVEKINPDDSSVTIRTQAGVNDSIKPFRIMGQLITALGVYDIGGVRYWICKE